MDQIRLDVLAITTNANEFGSPIVFVAPGGQTVTINGRTNKIHIKFDYDGTPVNGKNATITVAEKAMVDAGYIIRNANGEVDLYNHKVSWVDSTGASATYSIKQTFPDESIGLIVCILGDFKTV